MEVTLTHAHTHTHTHTHTLTHLHTYTLTHTHSQPPRVGTVSVRKDYMRTLLIVNLKFPDHHIHVYEEMILF